MAGKTYDVSFQLLGEVAGSFVKSFKAASSTFNDLGESVKNMYSQASKIEKIVGLRNEVDTATKAVYSLNGKVGGLSTAFKNAQAANAEMSGSVSHARAEVTKAEQALEKKRATLKTLEGSLKSNSAVNKDLMVRVARLRAEVDTAKRSLDEKRTTLKQLESTYKNNQKNVSQLGQKLAKAQKDAEKARLAFEKKNSTLKEVEAQNKATGVSTDKLVAKQNALEASAGKVTRAMNKMAKAQAYSDKLTKAAIGASVKLGATIYGAGKFYDFAVKKAMTFESAMADVRKVTGLQGKELQKLGDEFERMSLEIPLTADGLAQIASSAAQSGVAAKDLASFTREASKMSIAFDISAEESGEMMAKWRSGMGLTMDETYKLADAVNYLSNSDAARASQIGEVIKRYGALGKVSGLTGQQTAALATSIIAAGAEAQPAATALKALMREMQKGGSMTSDQKAAFKFAGIDPKQLQEDVYKDAPDAIVKMLEKIKRNVAPKRLNQYLNQMFGDEAARAIGPMMANLDGLKKNFAKVADEANYAGSMTKEYQARLNTAENMQQLFSNSLEYLGRAMGKQLLEPMKTVMEMFGGIVISLADFMNKHQRLTKVILVVIASLAALSVAVNSVVIAYKFLASPLIKAYQSFQSFKGLLEAAAKAKESDIKLTWKQAAAQKIYDSAVATGAKIKQLWTTITSKAFWLKVKEKVATIASTVAIKAKTAAMKVAAVVQKLWTSVCNSTVKTLIKEKVALIANKVALIASKVAIIAITAAQWAWNAAMNANPIGLVILAIAALIAIGIALWKNWDKIKAGAVALWGGIKTAWDGICSAITWTWNAIKSVTASAWNGIKAVIVTPCVAIYNSIKSFFTGAWNVIKSVFGWMKGGASGAFGAIKNGVLNLWATFSEKFPMLSRIVTLAFLPIRVAIQAGIIVFKLLRGVVILLWNLCKMAFNGIKTACVTAWNWITEKTSALWNKLKEFGSWIWNGLKSMFIGAWNAIKSFFSSTWNGLVSILSAGWNKFKSFMAWLWSGFKAPFVAVWNTIKVPFLNVWNIISSKLVNVWNKIKSFGSYIWGGFKEKFVGAFTWIRDGIANAFSGLKGIVKSAINGVIKVANKCIGALNKISFNLPEIMGGGHIGFNLSKIPLLAKGGIATAPTLAMIGEGREPEAVTPISKLEKFISDRAGGGTYVFNYSPVINISGGGSDAYEDVKRGIDEGQRIFKREMEKYLKNQRRLSYT